MLAGVGGMDLVLLIVAADESVMPQTREHFHICRLLHVPRGVVVLTKSDLVDEETLAIARLDVRELVADSFLARCPGRGGVVAHRRGPGGSRHHAGGGGGVGAGPADRRTGTASQSIACSR